MVDKIYLYRGAGRLKVDREVALREELAVTDGDASPEDNSWSSISWLILFFILHVVGVWLYTEILQAGGVVSGAAEIQEYSLRPESLAGLSFAAWILVIPALVLAARSVVRPWWQGVGLVRFNLRHLYVWVLILGVYLGLERIAVELLQVDIGEFMQKMVGQRDPFLILTIVVWAPLTEELLFRGYLFEVWRRSRLGLWGTLIFTSSLFALMHSGQYGVASLVFMFCFSFLMGATREQSGSVWLPIILHSLANLMSVILVNFLGLT